MNDIKEEFEENFVDENYRKDGRTPHGYTEWLAEPETVWLWIEQKIKKARIDENKRWVKQIADGFGYQGGIHCKVFENRISELEKMKTAKEYFI
jgi:hypothetical protein